MRIRTMIVAAAAAALMMTGSAHAATPVTSLSGDFAASNSTVTLTPDGVHFGTYADGGALGGSLTYHGFDGHALSELSDFSYTFTYRQAGSSTGAAPYARVFLDDGEGGIDDVVLDPSFCATTTPAQATDLTYQVVGGSVRWDDDGCDGVAPDNQPYAAAIAGHEDEKIVGLLVSQGFSTGSDVSALLRQITVNGQTFAFGAPQAGPAGQPGKQGPAGVTSYTVVLEQPASPAAVQGVCTGDQFRTIHAPSRRGERFLSVRATLRGAGLPVKGRAILVPLIGKAEGNYNVHLTSRYRTAHGHVRTVKTTRNLSVVCA